MKKWILAALLCALVLAALIPGTTVRADNGLSFVAVNDYLPPELINTVVYYGGTAYVPSWLFTNYSLGLNYSYMTSNSTAYLFNSARQLFFELATGRTYDTNDNEYDASAIMWGGTVYFPLAFVSSYYGTFSYRMIGSNEYGSILRLCTGSEVLSDDVFFRAALSAMQRYYQAWMREAQPRESAAPTPAVTQPPVKPTEKPSREGDTIRLGLEGLPSEAVLTLLRGQNIRACFFLRADEILREPDLVRRLACEGYTLGVCCPEGDAAACVDAAELLWETARVSTILASMPEGAVRPDGMIVFPTAADRIDPEADPDDIAYSVTSKLDIRAGDQTLIFPADGADASALRILLYYLSDLEFSVTALRETDGGGTPITP